MARSIRIAQLAASIAAINLNHPTRIAIDGVDGVGKTTLADELVEPLTRMGRPVIRASVDGFHRPRQARYRLGADSPEGYFLDSFDYTALLSQLLHPLGPGGTRRFRRAVFDYRSDRPVDVPPETAGANAILLFDGVFLQRAELAGAWDIRIWVDAPFGVTVPRAVSRDAIETDRAAVIRAQYERRYVPGQLLYMDRCRPKDSADIVVNNADLKSPGLRYRRFGQAAQLRDGAVGAGTDDDAPRLIANVRQTSVTSETLPTITGERVALRPFATEDVTAVAILANDRSVHEGTRVTPFPYTRADAKLWIDGHSAYIASRAGYPFAVIDRRTGKLVGAVEIRRDTNDSDAYEIGYWIGAPCRSRGFATEAVRLVLGFAAQHLPPRRVGAYVDIDNMSSRRVLTKCGMRLVKGSDRSIQAYFSL